MSWRDTKLAARKVVHETFQREAHYYPNSNVSGSGVSVMVRVHGQKVMTGDLDREGYAQVVDDIERVMFLQSDVIANGVVQGGYVKMLDDGVVYHLALAEPVQDGYTKPFQVVRK